MANLDDEDGLYSMSRHHRDVLNRCRTFLIRNLIVKPIIDEFVTHGLINCHQEEALTVCKTNTELVRRFCNELTRLGPTAFLAFLEALTATNQQHVREFVESRNVETDAGAAHKPRQPARTRHMVHEHGDASSEPLNHGPTKSVNDLLLPSSTIDLKAKQRSKAYRMRGGKYVNAMIVNNEDFSVPSLTTRYGSFQDVKNLEELFRKVLHFNVQTYTNLKAAELRQKLASFSKEQGEADACIVVIMSHGNNGLIYGTDGEIITVRSAMELFGAEQCKNLIDKPKYFIFQSCRGEHKETGVDRTDAVLSEEATAPIEVHTSGKDSSFETKFIPEMVDTLVSYATLSGFVSWRNSENGSWFIQAFCSVFRENAANEDVMTLLTMVTNELVKKYGDGYVQLCEHTTRLRSLFFLTPNPTS